MAQASGKKGRKPKGTVISLQTFLSNGDTTPLGTTQVAKNVRNIDGDDSDDGENVHTVVCQLPTAPRANRVFDENHVPHKGPFIAYVTNLPFDIHEEDIYTFFNNNNIVSVRLPREDGESGRVRGFGYVEFETRDDLVYALGLPDPSIKGRRIRIELSNESDQNSRNRGNRRGYDSSNSENRESTNWRRDNYKNDSRNDDYERSDQKSAYSDGTPGSWRSRNRSYGTDGGGGGGGEGRKYGSSYSEYKSDANQQERPKLNLKPRTLPIPEQDIPLPEKEPIVEDKPAPDVANKSAGVSAEKVFGSAKPVDTTARDLAIEQRLLESRKQESLRQEVEGSTSKINDIHIQSAAKEPLVENNWRKPDSSEQGTKQNDGPDNRRDAYRDRDNRRKYPEKSDRYDQSNETRGGDAKPKDVSKGKREVKAEQPLPKYSPKQQEPALVSTNKYSGLDDDDDDVEE